MKTFIAMAGGVIIFIFGAFLGAYSESDEIQQFFRRKFQKKKEDHTSSVLHDCEVKGFCSDYAE